MSIIILSLVIGVLSLLLIAAIIHINKLQIQVNLLDKEQHTQNDDILKLMKISMRQDEMLSQHIDVLKYLIEQDPMMSKVKMPYLGPIGQA
jgi:hypothetical protein